VNPWAFVIAAYCVALAGTSALLVWAFFSMRRAEAEVEKLRARE
jgi:hypothetical protein